VSGKSRRFPNGSEESSWDLKRIGVLKTEKECAPSSMLRPIRPGHLLEGLEEVLHSLLSSRHEQHVDAGPSAPRLEECLVLQVPPVTQVLVNQTPMLLRRTITPQEEVSGLPPSTGPKLNGQILLLPPPARNHFAAGRKAP
jgi:hypothetical protein